MRKLHPRWDERANNTERASMQRRHDVLLIYEYKSVCWGGFPHKSEQCGNYIQGETKGPIMQKELQCKDVMMYCWYMSTNEFVEGFLTKANNAEIASKVRRSHVLLFMRPNCLWSVRPEFSNRIKILIPKKYVHSYLHLLASSVRSLCDKYHLDIHK